MKKVGFIVGTLLVGVPIILTICLCFLNLPQYARGGSIWEAVSAVGGVSSVLVAILVYSWNAEEKSKERRMHYIESLQDRFSEDRVLEIVGVFDSSDGTDAFFQKMKEQMDSNPCGFGENREILEKSLRFIERLCYLRDKQEITEEEFLFFQADIISILSDSNIQNYIKGKYCRRDVDNGLGRFRNVRSFMDRKDLWNELPCAEEDSVVASGDLTLKDFKQDTMIIKINKGYCEGMTFDEIYEKVRGFWVVRTENANKCQVVLAVADGKVRGAYLCDHWERLLEGSRSYFIRKENSEKEKELQRSFVGKSVCGLFPKGASNPIRYFKAWKSNNTSKIS